MDENLDMTEVSPNGGPPGRVNFNTADLEQLTSVPGVGPVRAQRILESRPFESVEDLTRVSGIGPNLLERLRPYIALDKDRETVAGEAPEAEVSPAVETPEEAGTEPEVGMQVEPEEIAGVEPEEGGPLAIEQEAPPEAEAVTVESLPEEAPTEAIPEPEAPAIEETTPVTTEPTPAPKGISRSGAFWLVVGGSLLSLILALALSLGILASINNGSLQFASPGQIADVNRRVDDLLGRAETLQNDIGGLRTRLDNLEALGPRVDSVEEMTTRLEQDMQDTAAQVTELSQQAEALSAEVGAVSEQVDTLANQSERVQNFLIGLQNLLNELFAPEAAP